MKIVVLIASLILSLTTNAAYEKKSKKDDIKEYGIVILPSSECISKLSPAYQSLSKEFSSKNPISFIPHITLFKGAFHEAQIKEIKEDLSLITLPINSVELTNLETVFDRITKYNIKDITVLSRLHELVAHISVGFKARTLKIVEAEYKNLSDNQKAQVDKYGIYGIFKEYDPGMIIFRLPEADKKLLKIQKSLLKSSQNNFTCPISSMAIGHTDYAGNLVDIIHEFKIKVHPNKQ
jgi:hypothetical protein